MINMMIDDINKALDAEAYLSALALVLALPDICAKAELNCTPCQGRFKLHTPYFLDM